MRKLVALVGAWVCLSVAYLVGFALTGHLYAGEAAATQPLVPFFVGFAISNGLLVAFFSWVTDEMDSAMKAGLTIAVSQLLLVNVTYVFSGSRTISAGIASSMVLLISWPLVAFVYSALLGRRERARPSLTAPEGPV